MGSKSITEKVPQWDKYHMAHIEQMANDMQSLISRIVSKYCGELDKYIAFVQGVVQDNKQPPSNIELDDFALNIPLFLYFASEGQERVGLAEDVAKEIYKEYYNKTFQDADGAIAERKAKAELKVQEEQLAHMVYQCAYKQIKLRIEAAQEVLNSVKKVIGRREAEYNLSRKVRS